MYDLGVSIVRIKLTTFQMHIDLSYYIFGATMEDALCMYII